MTNQQGAPEALRLADLLRQQAAYHREVASDCDMRAENTINWGHGEVCCRAADELLRLHAYCQELEAQVILDCMTHGQQSAEIEHVVGDVSKNGAESNMAQQPAPSAAHVVADALADSQYLAGVSAGWNAANADDPNSALQKLHESRAGYLKPLSAARAQADSVPTCASNAAETLTIPEECPHIIWFDDHEMRPAIFAGTGARKSALATFKKISVQWNAHLFVRVEKNSRDDRYPCASAQVADSVLEDTARLDWLDQNIFYREMDEWDAKHGGRGDCTMWVIFAPKGHQGSARNIIDAARKQGGA